jgi:peptide/nickel transport system substrate-binding protein
VSDKIRAGLAVAVVLSSTVACTADPARPASGDPDGSSIVLAVAGEPAELNPLAGYGDHGAAKIFDGLVEYEPNLSLRPALAAAVPTPSADGLSWTVPLRSDVRFSDGSPFDATDVVDTYTALLDPAQNWPMRQRFAMVTGVVQVDAATVRFDLAQPYAPFPKLLTLGILPSETLVPDKIAHPRVGTGPYTVADWKRGQRLVLAANKSYWDGPPAVTRVTIEFIPDDERRRARMREGKIDGTALPPKFAAEFAETDGLTVAAHTSAEVRAVTLPAAGPVTGDPAIRLALNHALDRETIADGTLAGEAVTANTPMPDVLAEFVEPGAEFEHDIPKALEILGDGGWQTGQTGRVKNGTPAEFPVNYLAGDTVGADLADRFASAASAIGVLVTPTEVDELPPDQPAVVSFGDPVDPDLALSPVLRSADPSVDASLATGRAATDPAERATAYRKLQRDYLEAPNLVVLTEPNHTYVLRQSWDGYQPIVDGATADFTWGAWWNLQKWTPR